MVPMLQDRVRLGSSKEVFLVVGIDHSRRTVDVTPTTGEFMVIQDLPFACLRRLLPAQIISMAA